MVGKRKRGIDINDKSLWGHRFDFRERCRVQRQPFVPYVGPSKIKKPRQEKDPFVAVKPSKKPKTKEPKPKKKIVRKRDDPFLVAKELLDELIYTIEAESGDFSRLGSSTYVNCDLRYFNLEYLVEKYGHLDVLVVDPPWRIRGGQKNSDSPYMFSNNKFSLEYDTLSNQEIMDIPLEKLSRKGFCFLWVLSGNINAGYECLNKWGYECVEHLVWVKTAQGGKRAMVSHGFYFLHSTETCLVGYKCPVGERCDFRAKISNDLIIADVRKKSQKPDHLYTLIDLMMPGAKKAEVFARNHNLRPGWLSLGNQIGEAFEKWRNMMTCDRCKTEISEGVPRYKSRRFRNFDICEDCIESTMSDRHETISDYFKLQNESQKDVLHHYHKCDRCGIEPIWGNRFQCLQCENVDYCENCYDEIIESKTGCFAHTFEAHEQPQAGFGLPVQEGKRCVSCYQKPILGPCFICADCNHLVLCQNCYFNCSLKEFEKIKGHDSKHKIEMITLALHNCKISTCQACGRSPLISPRYRCNECFSYELCEECYLSKEALEVKPGQTHEATHTFTNY